MKIFSPTEESGKKKRKRKRSNMPMPTLTQEDEVTRVYGCATMWHESPEEVCEMLKSIFRMDEDYSAR